MARRTDECAAGPSGAARTRARQGGRRTAHAGTDGARSTSVFHAEVVDVQMREEDDVDLVEPTPSASSCAGRWPSSSAVQSHSPGGPTPVSTRIVTPSERIRYETQGSRHACLRTASDSARGTVPSQRARRQGRPRRVAEEPDRVGNRFDLDRADYHCTRGGAGSWCASCHEITGFRSTPIFSISHSMTSPGLR